MGFNGNLATSISVSVQTKDLHDFNYSAFCHYMFISPSNPKFNLSSNITIHLQCIYLYK